jgi:peptidoglycan/LPS O-acetylase OafA/YrhL
MGLKHRPALDGIRAIAITLVVCIHAFHTPVGGHFGVDVFFVLSGFLITSMLAAEHGGTGTIAVRSFYVRRARRLLPALFVLLAVFLVVRLWLGSAHEHWNDALAVGAGIAYCMNFVAAFAPGFLLHPGTHALTHLWSLATEEQFYLVWPLALVLLLRFAPRRAALVILAVCVGSALWRIALVESYSRDRVYFALDTRLDGLLLGSVVGLLWVNGLLPAFLRSAARRRTLLAAAAVPTLAAFTTVVYGTSTWAVALVAVNLASALLVLEVVLAEDAPVARLLQLAPIAYLGRISYSLYLWHVPLFEAYIPGRASTFRILLAIAAALGAAVTSYHVIEKPFRRRRASASAELVPAASSA